MKQRPSRREWLAACMALGLSLAGCHRKQPGAADVPPDEELLTGPARDLCPRWSNDGRQIAFLRTASGRKYQLFTAHADLSEAVARLEPVLINPDRPFVSSRANYFAPQEIAWSPDNLRIAMPRVEWFHFDDGERIPGSGLYAIDLSAGKAEPLAAHPREYED